MATRQSLRTHSVRAYIPDTVHQLRRSQNFPLDGSPAIRVVECKPGDTAGALLPVLGENQPPRRIMAVYYRLRSRHAPFGEQQPVVISVPVGITAQGGVGRNIVGRPFGGKDRRSKWLKHQRKIPRIVINGISVGIRPASHRARQHHLPRKIGESERPAPVAVSRFGNSQRTFRVIPVADKRIAIHTVFEAAVQRVAVGACVKTVLRPHRVCGEFLSADSDGTHTVVIPRHVSVPPHSFAVTVVSRCNTRRNPIRIAVGIVAAYRKIFTQFTPQDVIFRDIDNRTSSGFTLKHLVAESIETHNIGNRVAVCSGMRCLDLVDIVGAILAVTVGCYIFPGRSHGNKSSGAISVAGHQAGG